MSTNVELRELIDIIDELATVVSDIRSRQMHYQPGVIRQEVKPIKDKLRLLKEKLENQL
jgi:hypothetical protein